MVKVVAWVPTLALTPTPMVVAAEVKVGSRLIPIWEVPVRPVALT
jgi:hypothetical protein